LFTEADLTSGMGSDLITRDQPTTWYLIVLDLIS